MPKLCSLFNPNSVLKRRRAPYKAFEMGFECASERRKKGERIYARGVARDPPSDPRLPMGRDHQSMELEI